MPRLRTNRRKVVFSGAAHHANEAAGADYFADLGGESTETGLGGGWRSLTRTSPPREIREKTGNFRDFGRTGDALPPKKPCLV
jgi:hypothetical protein